MPVETKYARSGDLSIAYQVIGDGPIDVLWVPGFVSHLEQQWDHPHWRRMFGRYAAFSRFIRFDKRGTGLSDRVPVATLEERMDDVRAVLDAVGSERTAIVGLSEGGPLALLFAATYPERVTALALVSSFARLARADDHPEGVTPEVFAGFRDLDRLAVGRRHGPVALLRRARCRRGSGWSSFGRASGTPPRPGTSWPSSTPSPRSTSAPSCSTISAPTLVVHGSGDPIVPVACGRQLADGIDGARYVELDLGSHGTTDEADIDLIVDEVEEFLTGVRHTPEPDRVLATVLFTDIVSSTERAATLGDRAWRDVLRRHDGIVAEHVASHRGRLIKSTGDGALATFDGPAPWHPLREHDRRAQCGRWGSRCGPASTAASARSSATTSAASPSTSGPGWHRWRVPRRSSCRAPSRTSWWDQASASPARGTHTLKGVPGEWNVYAVG